MRLPGEPEQYICWCHTFSPDAGLRRERWLFEMEADRLCDSDIGSLVAITSPSERMVKLERIALLDRTVYGIDDDKPQRLIVLQTDDGDWEMRRDRRIWLCIDPTISRGSTLRWPVGETGDPEQDRNMRWTTEPATLR